MHFVKKTSNKNRTLHVDIGYQDSDGVPNLYIEFSGFDEKGNDIRDPREWSRSMVDLYHKTIAALKDDGFENCGAETMRRAGNVDLSQGMEHARQRTPSGLEGAGKRVLEELGFEISTIKRMPPRRSYVERAQAGRPNQAFDIPGVDFEALRQEFARKTIEAFGDSPKTQLLVTSLTNAVKKSMGVKGFDGPSH